MTTQHHRRDTPSLPLPDDNWESGECLAESLAAREVAIRLSIVAMLSHVESAEKVATRHQTQAARATGYCYLLPTDSHAGPLLQA